MIRLATIARRRRLASPHDVTHRIHGDRPESVSSRYRRYRISASRNSLSPRIGTHPAEPMQEQTKATIAVWFSVFLPCWRSPTSASGAPLRVRSDRLLLSRSSSPTFRSLRAAAPGRCKSAREASSSSSATRCSNLSFLSPGAFGSSVSPCLHSLMYRRPSGGSHWPSPAAQCGALP